MASGAQKKLNGIISRLEEKIKNCTKSIQKIDKEIDRLGVDASIELYNTRRELTNIIAECNMKLNIIERDCLQEAVSLAPGHRMDKALVPMRLVRKSNSPDKEEYIKNRLSALNDVIPKDYYPEGYSWEYPYSVCTLLGVSTLSMGTEYWTNQTRPAVADVINHLGNRKL